VRDYLPHYLGLSGSAHIQCADDGSPLGITNSNCKARRGLQVARCFALQSDADALQAALQSERAAARSVEIAQGQLRLGEGSYLSVLTAEQLYQTSRNALVQAQARRLSDTAALFAALGGGWWNRDDVALGCARGADWQRSGPRAGPC
jgi:Outer membrane efflux protein